MISDVQRFFDAYRDAFNRLDPVAIAAHFAVPSMLTSTGGDALWTDAAQIQRNMVVLCDRYRAAGFVAARYEPLHDLDLPPDHVVAHLRWTVERRDLPPWSFRTGYHLRRRAETWRILLCIAYEEPEKVRA